MSNQIEKNSKQQRRLSRQNSDKENTYSFEKNENAKNISNVGTKINISNRQAANLEKMKKVAEEKADLSYSRYRLASMITKNGCQPVFGYNHDRTTLRGRTLCSFHAEIEALSQVLRGTNYQCEKERFYQPKVAVWIGT